MQWWFLVALFGNVLADPIKISSKCGLANHDTEVTSKDDNQAHFGEFPWMAAVLSHEIVDTDKPNVTVFQCGASLIHPKVALTAAQCFQKKDRKFSIRAGEWNPETKSEILAHQQNEAEKIIIHPEFSPEHFSNDIALVIVKKAFEIAKNVDIICLPKQGEIVENTRCYVSGWGKNKAGKDGRYSSILKKIDVPIVSRDVCEEKLGNYFTLHENSICAGGELGKGACKGDNGGPLMCPLFGEKGRYFQAGIVSREVGCGQDQLPEIYTNVAKYINWIDEQLASHDIEKH